MYQEGNKLKSTEVEQVVDVTVCKVANIIDISCFIGRESRIEFDMSMLYEIDFIMYMQSLTF